MCPYLIAWPSTGWRACSGPARLRMSGSRLGLCAGTCRTRKMAAGRPAGNEPTSFIRASTPPADAPITITSCLGIVLLSLTGRCLDNTFLCYHVRLQARKIVHSDNMRYSNHVTLREKGSRDGMQRERILIQSHDK